jgi:hypothetical protein
MSLTTLGLGWPGGSDSYWLPGARREEPTGGAAIAVVERIIGVESAVIADGAGPTYLGMNLETDRPRRQRMSRAAAARRDGMRNFVSSPLVKRVERDRDRAALP